MGQARHQNGRGLYSLCFVEWRACYSLQGINAPDTPAPLWLACANRSQGVTRIERSLTEDNVRLYDGDR